MKPFYFLTRARCWPGLAVLGLGLAAGHAGRAQATLTNPAGGVFNQTGSLYNTGTVRNAGTYQPTSGTLLVAGGDFINTGAIGTGAATVRLVEGNATTSHVLALGEAALPNLDLDVPAGTTLTSGGTVLGTLTLRSGHLLGAASSVLTLGPAATIVGETDAHYIKGRVAQVRSLSGSQPVDMGGLGVAVDPAGSTFPLTVERRAGLTQAGVSYGANPSMPTQHGIDRVWALSSTTTSLATPAVLTLSWLPADDHGLSFAGTNAQVWRSDDGGASWTTHGPAQSGAARSVSVETTQLNALYTVSSSAAPLPVQLTSFVARLQSSEAVALSWNTASELNTDHFEIERSLDGQHFAQLSQVAAQGTSTTAHTYAYRDAALPGGVPTLYYRLRTVDHDKSAAYSPVRTVAVPGRAAEFSLSVAPNPAAAGTSASLWVASPAPAAGTLTVLNALGQVVGTRRATLLEGSQHLPLDMQHLPAGVYTLRLQAHGRTATAKLLVH
ncbi:MAG TPA: T9SS type A sorting domain-containing protein [Hymenobacter sp.]|uniref:T9SS type A sorting domain-containing protein n=1 Tax=Hymenobacter sp. TaxID=1898978 RepID=UPI002D810FFF|nr:T9SS type A sorting domain-containing protein [Hymenobacter sp.]HET9502392.1 T9SS type A sorting domain-containing protein [Hymenobacter sp.]